LKADEKSEAQSDHTKTSTPNSPLTRPKKKNIVVADMLEDIEEVDRDSPLSAFQDKLYNKASFQTTKVI
jgi:hypothetical protein